MAYAVLLRQSAQKELDSFNQVDYKRIAGIITGLETNPHPPGTRKLFDSGLWRIRRGSLRVIYAIDDDHKKVVIVRITRRAEDTYKGI